MIWLALILWLGLSLFSPDSLATYYGDIPLIAILLSQKKLSIARYAAFLSILNGSFDSHALLGVSVLIRLLSIDFCYFLLKNAYASLFIRASLATCLLVLFDWICSCFLLPNLFPSLFYETPLWDTKLVLFSLALVFGLTCSLFVIYHIALRYWKDKLRNRK
jgi:hypothetical protein